MPLASYDYDYYEYVNGRRTSKTTYAPQTTNKRSSATGARKTTTSQTRRVATSTKSKKATNATRPQTRKNVSTTSKKTLATTKKAAPKTTTVKRAKTTTSKVASRTTQRAKKYDIDIPIRTSSKIANKPKEMTLKKPKAKVNAALALKQALTRTFGVAVFFAIAFAICYRYSLMNEEFIELRNIKKEYETIQNVNEQLEADIESKTDLTYIENYAKYQLGMQKPSDSQLKYVSIEKRDRVLTPVTIEEETDANWFTKLCEEVRKLLD